MPSPTRRDTVAQQARLHSQIAEIEAQRDSLMQSLLPLMPVEEREPNCTSAIHETNAASTSASSCQSSASDKQLSQATIDRVLEHSTKTVKQHIELLHAYNGIRDVGQGLIGLIAEQRGVRVKDLMEEFGVDVKD